jgi:hypothetical protein
MSTTDKQYLAYLKKRLAALEESKRIMEEQEKEPSSPSTQLYRIRSNGAGNFIYTRRKWKKT